MSDLSKTAVEQSSGDLSKTALEKAGRVIFSEPYPAPEAPEWWALPEESSQRMPLHLVGSERASVVLAREVRIFQTPPDRLVVDPALFRLAP